MSRLPGPRRARCFAPHRCESLEPRCLLAAGGLDPSFGDAGRATVDFGIAVTATSVAVQLDGKTVVAGYSSDKRFALARYNIDGSLDTTFGPTFNGTVLTAFGHGTFANAVALQDDGKIVAAGGFSEGIDVARYNPDGTLDASFNPIPPLHGNPLNYAGRQTLNFDGGDNNPSATALAILPRQSLDAPQRIIVAGTVDHGTLTSLGDHDFFVLRLSGPNGYIDESFGDDGSNIIGLGDEDRLSAVALDFSYPSSDPRHGSIVAVGTRADDRYDPPTYSMMAVVRLTPGGSLDSSFDGDGKRSFTMAPGVHTAATGLVVQNDGKYVVGGTVGDDLGMVRLLPGGAFDHSFGTAGTGWVQTDMGGIEKGTDLKRSYEGGLIIGGTSLTGPIGSPGVSRNAFAAYSANGILDSRFGSGGKWTINFGGGGRFADGPGRRFVFAGGGRMQAFRFTDVGANLVRAAVIDPLAYEQFQNTATVAVYRSEILPVATRVYFYAYGTATAPGEDGRGGPDYNGIPRSLSQNGIHRVDIPAGQAVVFLTLTPVQDIDAEGNETASFSLQPDAAYEIGSPSVATFTIVDDDAPPPGPAAVYVRSSTWAGRDADPANVTFKEYLKAAGLGDDTYGYRVDDKPATDVLPWINLDEIVVRYTSPPVLTGAPPGSSIVLDGMRSDYPAASITELDPQTFLLRFDRPLGGDPATAATNGDRIHMAFPGSGGFHHYDIRVLQGDTTQNGTVLATDYAEVKKRFFRTASSPGAAPTAYSPLYDIDGNGSILARDYAEVKKRFFHNLPGTFAAAPAIEPLARRFRPGVRDDVLGAGTE